MTEALRLANEAFEKIKILEKEKKHCKDEARKIELDDQIQALRRKQSEQIVKATAAGFGFSVIVAVSGAVCGAIF